MKTLKDKVYVGERPLFMSDGLEVENCVFKDGESPLKESRNIRLKRCTFDWKYPLWYCNNVSVDGCTLTQNARAGIWYTRNVTFKDVLVDAPKSFRRSDGIVLENVRFSNASETLWNCADVNIKDVVARGDYLAMNCRDVVVENLDLVGNYAFDGAKNVVVRNSRLMTKDAFWNCENVTVYDSVISGEYTGWNSKNLTFVNCELQSLQGFCYIDGLVMKNCRMKDTTLAFEYSTLDVEVDFVDSVINPSGGVIRAKRIGQLILDDDNIDKTATQYIISEK